MSRRVPCRHAECARVWVWVWFACGRLGWATACCSLRKPRRRPPQQGAAYTTFSSVCASLLFVARSAASRVPRSKREFFDSLSLLTGSTSPAGDCQGFRSEAAFAAVGSSQMAASAPAAGLPAWHVGAPEVCAAPLCAAAERSTATDGGQWPHAASCRRHAPSWQTTTVPARPQHLVAT